MRQYRYPKNRIIPISSKSQFLYGKHAVFAALSNPKRIKIHLWCLDSDTPKQLHFDKLLNNLDYSITDKYAIDDIFPDRRTQGIVLECEAHPLLAFSELKQKIIKNTKLDATPSKQIILVLDHVQDERNIGGLLRLAYLYGVECVIMTKDHSPKESADMANTACGALDRVERCYVTNLARTLQSLHEVGYWCYGLDTIKASNYPLPNPLPDKICLVVGSEGKGLRKQTLENCQLTMHIDTPGKDVKDKFAPDSLNTTMAVAIGLSILKPKQ